MSFPMADLSEQDSCSEDFAADRTVGAGRREFVKSVQDGARGSR